MPAFGDYQNEIYFKGLSGVKPKLPVNFKLLEQKAHAALPDSVLNYVAGGCGDERTQDHNVAAFDRWGIIPRMMVDCSKRDMSVNLFGLQLPSPLFMAPIGYEIATHLGFLQLDPSGLVWFGDLRVSYALVATGFCIALIIYYLVWKHFVNFFNELLGIA